MSDASTAPGLPSPRQPRGHPAASRELDVVKVAAGLVSAAVIIAGLYYGRDILIPLAIAFLILFVF